MTNLILVGFMGSGKSTIGRELANILQRPFIEMDLEIEKKVGKSISTIFEEVGETVFREIETEVLSESLSQGAIIATGGGIVTQVENHRLLENETCVVYLKGELSTLIDRIKSDQINYRPLAKNDEVLEQLFTSREEAYESIATHCVFVDNKTISDIISEIEEEMKGLAR